MKTTILLLAFSLFGLFVSVNAQQSADYYLITTVISPATNFVEFEILSEEELTMAEKERFRKILSAKENIYDISYKSSPNSIVVSCSSNIRMQDIQMVLSEEGIVVLSQAQLDSQKTPKIEKITNIESN